MPAIEPGELVRRLGAAVRRVDDLRLQFKNESAPYSEIAAGALEELSVALEELTVTAEDLHSHADDLTRTRAELELESIRYRELFDLAPEAYFVTDLNGIITEANRAANSLLDAHSRQGLTGTAMALMFSGPSARAFYGVLRRIGAGLEERIEIQLEVQWRDVPPLRVAALAAPVANPDGSIRGVRWIFRDITEIDLARHDLQVALQRQQEETELLRAAESFRQSLLLSAAHDLRSPVTLILGFASMLENRSDLSEDQQSTAVAGLTRGAKRLVAVVSNVLDVERLEAGVIAAQRRPVVLDEFGRSCLQLVEVGDHPVELVADTKVATFDPGLAHRIVDNLLSNAARHAPAGTVIRFSLHAVPDGTLIGVDDEGPGVPDDLKEAIFERFERGPEPGKGGLGVGLYVVHRFAELQGGRAWVEDRPGGGAAFRVLLR